jgi:hypothetical protein
MHERMKSAYVIAAAIIVAVRLARDDINRPSPKLTCAVADSVGLARMVLQRVLTVIRSPFRLTSSQCKA